MIALVNKYKKGVVAFLAAIAATVTQIVALSADNAWSYEDTIVTVLVFLGAIGVVKAENTVADGAEVAPDGGQVNWIALACIAIIIVAVLIVISLVNINVKG